jgi:acetyl esterase/lipase
MKNSIILKRQLIFTFISLSMIGSAFSQKTIKVWTGQITGSIENISVKEITDSSDNWIKTRNITDPTFDMYPVSAEKSNGTSVIICPGGAYWALAIKHEGSDIAKWFNIMGITAFVLKYRLPLDGIMADKSIGPLQDAQEAMRNIRRHAKEWNINPDKIGIMGFSAGGHLASTLSTRFNDKVYKPVDTTSARPDFSILIYPVISMDATMTHMGSRENLIGKNPSTETVKRFSNDLQVTKNTPPAFLAHSMDDDAVPVQNSISYALALKKYKIPCELHIYEKGGHGYGLGRSIDTESTWPEACIKWLRARGFL